MVKSNGNPWGVNLKKNDINNFFFLGNLNLLFREKNVICFKMLRFKKLHSV